MNVKYPDQLKEKISKMKQDGASNLHIVSDFDRTLTKAFVNGKKHESSYAFLEQKGYMGDDFIARSSVLEKYYYPFEIDVRLSYEEKSKYMDEWWGKYYSMMIKYGFNQEMTRACVLEYGIHFRESCFDFFEKLVDEDLPILILSAGVGDIIKEIMSISNLTTPNIHIISNFFDFDPNGLAVDYKTPLIHTYNKNEVAVKESTYHKQIEDRMNVILLGDSLGDLKMADGLDHDCIIKIGFLNYDDAEMFEKYSEKFDVVITDDGPMFDVLDILSQILD